MKEGQMKEVAQRGFVAVMAGVLATVVVVVAQQPDNTARNKQDRTPTAKTADQQSNAKADIDVTRRIRQAIVADKHLSTNAHNVKIITRAGKVTLKGPVRTDAEKQTVEAKAAEVAGAGNVTSQVSVTSATSAKASTPKKPRKRAAAPKEQ
jgi:hyperosmotically inducible periplasmic protein